MSNIHEIQQKAYLDVIASEQREEEAKERFLQFMTIAKAEFVPSHVEGYFNLSRTLRSIAPLLQEYEFDNESKLAEKCVVRLENIKAEGIIFSKKVTGEGTSKTQIMNEWNMFVALSYLYARDELTDKKGVTKMPLTQALDRAAAFWGEVEIGQYIKNKSEELKERRRLNNIYRGDLDSDEIDDVKGKNDFIVGGGIIVDVKLMDFKEALPTSCGEAKDVSLEELKTIYQRVQQWTESRHLNGNGQVQQWKDGISEDIIETIRFVDAVKSGKMNNYKAVDLEYGYEEFLKSLGRVGTDIAQMQRRLGNKGIKTNILLGQIFDIRRSAVLKTFHERTK